MRFAFTEDQKMLRDSVRDMLAGECTPERVRAAWEDRQGRVAGLWDQLAELGVLGLRASEAAGGMGLDELDLVLLLEETGYSALPEPIVEHAAVGLPLLESLRGADERVKAAAEGKLLLTVGLDCSPHVNHAANADLLILQKDDSLHLLEREAVELHAQRAVDRSRQLFTVDWQATSESRLARGPEASREIARALNRGAVGSAAQLVGLARRMLQMTVEYVQTREQFGRPIGSFQALKHMLADTLLAIEMARPVVYRAAYTLAGDRTDQDLHASMAKVYASVAAHRTARVSLQCHGAIGYSVEHDLHLWMKRVWGITNDWGQPRWHRERVARLKVDGDST